MPWEVGVKLLKEATGVCKSLHSGGKIIGKDCFSLKEKLKYFFKSILKKLQYFFNKEVYCYKNKESVPQDMEMIRSLDYFKDNLV